VSRPPKAILAVLAGAAAVALSAGCGGGDEDVQSRGAQLFADRCAGCHTLEAVGAVGSAAKERISGPNLDKRKLTKDEALFAIRNGGFSGAIMPQNIVVGEDAEAVAQFLARYSGSEATSPPAPSGQEDEEPSTREQGQAPGD
jgi:cytochrome c551